ncbi:hypothetical protein G9P44_003419 [Scheffersomyces stipitis]|nr:hypothetical protein G9P44_003419 [Scheffersomyces stipitis]
MSSTDKVQSSNAVTYFSPEQPVPAGTYFQQEKQKKPLLFSPFKIRELILQNRLVVSPMCQYSAGRDGQATPYHLVHYGQFLLRGPGLTFVEDTSVSPEGRLSPENLGIWNDQQAEALKDIVEFAHSQKQLIGIQLDHGGRKASSQPNYIHLEQNAEESVGGWPNEIVAPSPIVFRPNGNLVKPNELSKSDISRIVNDFGNAAERAVKISGFDAIEIHGAHGYLINQFYSKISNKRKDEYGGSFENRIRFLLEVVDEVRSRIPSSIPLFLRISAIENTEDEDAWTLSESIKLSTIVVEHGVDVIDVSSGGNCHRQYSRKSLSKGHAPMHIPLAKAIKDELGEKVLVACVGSLNSATLIEDELKKGSFDIALVGKGFLNNPALVWKFAEELEIRVHRPLQYGYPFFPPIQQILELIAKSEEAET